MTYPHLQSSAVERGVLRVASVALAVASTAPLAAQSAGDTARVYGLETVVVTTERVAAPLSTATAAASVLPGAALRRLPLLGPGDLLRMVPGFSVVDADGSGRDPRLVVRGFYGGGETDYVSVMMDGRPINALETGVVDWDLVPLAAVRSVEVLRGGASPLYGDGAVGGVVNLITRMEPGTHRARITAGADGAAQLSAAGAETLLGRPARGWANLSRSDGFRDHDGRTSRAAGATVGLANRPGASLELSAVHRRRETHDPGPLPGPVLAESRTASSPLYRFDRASEQLTRLALDGRRETGSVRFSGYLAGEDRDAGAVRTLALAPDFADTKRRALRTRRALASAQVDAPAPRLGAGEARVTAGFDGALGWMRSSWFALLNGDADAYLAGAPGAGTPDERGSATRASAAGFVRYEARPVDRVRLSAGGRVDWLRDAWTPGTPSTSTAATAEHTAFSPRVGINVQYARGAGHQGWAYAAVGRSFKAATLDQLFDRRTIPVPFPPYSLTISNTELKPQHGISGEAGLYHRAALTQSLAASLSLAAYQVDMRDELDFDLQTFRYVNLGRSRHRGVEAALGVSGTGGWEAFANYTLQSATSRLGENAGKALKAVPRHTVAGGVDAPLPFGAAAAVTVTGARGIWLDDANTRRLAPWTRVDARLTVPVRGVRLWVEGFNLLDREYSTTGFPDSAVPSVFYYYPATGRSLQLGMDVGS